MSVAAGDGAWRGRTRVAAACIIFCERWLPLLLIAALALIERHFVVANTDVSWGFTLAEKVLAGERAYVDFIELNPPGAIYLYVPAILVARATALSPEVVMGALVFIVIGASLWFSARILRRADLLARFESARLLAMVVTILAILPAQIFAEREHIAVVLFLPMLCTMLVRASGRTPSWSEIVVAGLGAGATVILKPHLALGLAAAIATAAFSARSWKVLAAGENWIAFAVLGAYGATIAVAFPEFLSEIVPLVRAVYLPLRRAPSELLIGLPAVPLWISTLVAIALLRRAERYDRIYGIVLAASIGFAGSFFVQGKGWPYHSYPMMALALIALACTLSERRAPACAPLERGGWAVAAGVIAAMTYTWMNVATSLVSLEAPIRQIKPHPTMLTITSDVAVGHPLVRAVEGTWVASVGSMWITGGVLWRRIHETLTPEENARLDRYAALDREMLIAALRRRKPDVIVIQKEPADFERWARGDREIDDLLKSYSEALTTPEMVVLRRNGP